MNLVGYSHAVAALAYAALAITLLRRLADARGSPVLWLLGATAALSAGWAVANLGAQLGLGDAATLVASVLDLLRYAGLLALMFVVLGQGEGRRRSPTLLLLSALALCALAVLLLSRGLGPDAASSLLAAIPLASLALPVVGMLMVEQLYRGSAEASRWHLKPLCLALAIVFVYDIFIHSGVLLFGRFDPDALAARSAVHAMAVPLLYIASHRQADWRNPFQLSRDAAFHTATLVLVGCYLLFISATGYYLRHAGGDWGRALEIALLAAAVVGLIAMVVSGSLRAKARVFAGKHFFRYQYDYRNEWLRLTRRLTSADTPAEVGVAIVQGLAEMLNSPAGALWHRDAEGRLLVPAARWNSPRSDATVPTDSVFARFLSQREWVIDFDELRADPQAYRDAEVPDWLASDARRWLLVPLLVDNGLYGFVTIDRPHAVLHLNWEVRDLLKTASRQAASYLALMHATDALFEARKFEAFNKMSAFVVHDLKNIVAQLSLMLQNARKFKHNEEFQDDMLATVENSLDKMRRLTLQLRSGETPAGVASGVPLQPLVERLRAAVAARGRAIDIEAREPLVARGHEGRLERVLGHIVDNALDATNARGTVRLMLTRDAGRAKVMVSDTGEGMTAEFIAERLFKPFQSTKPQGMGIGAFESRQYVEQLGGEILVDSEAGVGTSITVLLPLLESGRTLTHELSEAR
jgi:putative PEP-CTERM system histidine kinase